MLQQPQEQHAVAVNRVRLHTCGRAKQAADNHSRPFENTGKAMSSISFRDRKNKQPIDAQFYLKDGREMSTATQHWQIGDSVSVCFPDQNDKVTAIRENAPRDIYIGNDGMIGVPCVVVRRYHSVVWKDVGAFQHLQDSSVTLEAESGLWEDILLWIMKGTVPEWAKA